ncbi:hypothetical protein LSH36_268g00017 [Paralvinella palmiformis]|uniref:EF-hand domain-containing protein n=1 Tax=Paralvinella palmiformis TaxID=53620 RepID=A0AAD9N4Y7_9ANNE|nr:hypothetical protein LSH36_268g00017 [Paralvinella palmiformis]
MSIHEMTEMMESCSSDGTSLNLDEEEHNYFSNNGCPNFVPNFKSLHLSAQHRLQNSTKRKYNDSAPWRRSISSQSRATVKRRLCRSAASSMLTENSESDGETKSVFTELDETSEDLQQIEGNIYQDPDELGEQTLNKEVDDISQKRYRVACRSLKVTPTTRILNSLTGTELNLNSHMIGEQGAHACSLALMINGTVERLNLESNALGSNGTLYICKMLKENIFITDLGQDVDHNFMGRLDEVHEMRGESLIVIYGLAMHEDQIKMIQQEEASFAKQDPITILMEYIRLKNLRLVDMFRSLDGDNSKSISRDEFKRGLMTFTIVASFQSSGVPVTDPMLDRIISKLDTNKNGEIEYNELIAGLREHKRNINKVLETSAINNVPFEQTELGKISDKLCHIMKIKEYFSPHKMRRQKTVASQTVTASSASEQNGTRKIMKDHKTQKSSSTKNVIDEETLTPISNQQSTDVTSLHNNQQNVSSA